MGKGGELRMVKFRNNRSDPLLCTKGSCTHADECFYGHQHYQQRRVAQGGAAAYCQEARGLLCSRDIARGQ